mgnify:FL=1
MISNANFKILRKRTNSSLFIRRLIAGIIILSVLSFTTYMGVIAFLRSSKNIEDLTYVSGEIVDREMSKYKRVGKYETTIEDVLVFRIEGSNEKFGFLQSSEAYRELLGFHTVGKSIEIYYDPEGKRIKDNVTLHIFDLKIGQAKIIDIDKTNKEDRIVSIFFIALTLFWVALIVISIRETKKKEKQLRSSKQLKITIPKF